MVLIPGWARKNRKDFSESEKGSTEVIMVQRGMAGGDVFTQQGGKSSNKETHWMERSTVLKTQSI